MGRVTLPRDSVDACPIARTALTLVRMATSSAPLPLPVATADRPPASNPAPTATAPAPAGTEAPSGRREAPIASLRQLSQLRRLAIVGQVVAILVAWTLGFTLPLLPMAGIIVGLVVFDARAGYRCRQGTPATYGELLAHFMVDLAGFTGLLMLSGGAANPFAMVFLLHIALMALLLPRRCAWIGAGVVTAAWLLSTQFALPLETADASIAAHVAFTTGRAIAFVLTAAMIVVFVTRVSSGLRAHERLLAETARKTLNDEAMLRIGSIAAGAAHELATPLMTMSVVVGEWQRPGAKIDVGRDAAIVAKQVAACKAALQNLRNAAQAARTEDSGAVPLDRFLDAIVERCRFMRPDTPVECHFGGTHPPPVVLADAALQQAILILLNNAADASPDHVSMRADWSTEELSLAIADRGPGIPPAKLGLLGTTYFTTKAPGRGTGLGVMLTASTAARLGGTVRWFNRPEGGACAELRIPLAGLRPKPTDDGNPS